MMKRQIAYTLDSREDSVRIRFEPFHEGKVDAIEGPCICDYDETGQLIGVEILRFGSLIGANALDMSGNDDQGQNGWITFDQCADAFYVKLGAAKSVRQIAVRARVLLDPEHRLTGLSVAKPRAQNLAS
jgi:uncharacterized protein YuzE